MKTEQQILFKSKSQLIQKEQNLKARRTRAFHLSGRENRGGLKNNKMREAII